MRYIILLILIGFSIKSIAQAQSDTNKILNAKIVALQNEFKAIKDTANIKCPPKCGLSNDELTLKHWLLIYLPMIIFLLVLIFLHRTLGRQFSLKDALTESSLSTKKIENPLLKQENADRLNQLLANPVTAAKIDLTPSIEISDESYAPSSSRYAALITVYFGLAIIACFISYYIYSYLTNPNKPIDLDNLKNVFLALLVGIAPYSFNKLSTAISPK